MPTMRFEERIDVLLAPNADSLVSSTFLAHAKFHLLRGTLSCPACPCGGAYRGGAVKSGAGCRGGRGICERVDCRNNNAIAAAPTIMRMLQIRNAFPLDDIERLALFKAISISNVFNNCSGSFSVMVPMPVAFD